MLCKTLKAAWGIKKEALNITEEHSMHDFKTERDGTTVNLRRRFPPKPPGRTGRLLPTDEVKIQGYSAGTAQRYSSGGRNCQQDNYNLHMYHVWKSCKNKATAELQYSACLPQFM